MLKSCFPGPEPREAHRCHTATNRDELSEGTGKVCDVIGG